jgi:thiamine biosynthesis lipoprotein
VVLALGGFGVGRALRPTPDRAEALVTRTRLLMGTLVEIRLPGRNAAIDERAVDAAFVEMARVERVFSPGKPGGGPATNEESAEVKRLVALGRVVGLEGEGALDLRMRDWIDLWGFESAPRRPSDGEIRAVREARLVRRPTGPLTEYVFGSVAKGYAVDRAVAVLKTHGVSRALVNAGGEVGVLGRGWTVGVQHPRNRSALLTSVRLDEGWAIATSGDYENDFVADGRRFHHLLIPATGMPALEVQSASVVAPSCTEADIWATALFVMGPKRAMALVKRHPELDVLLVDAQGRVLGSDGWNAGVPDGRP